LASPATLNKLTYLQVFFFFFCGGIQSSRQFCFFLRQYYDCPSCFRGCAFISRNVCSIFQGFLSYPLECILPSHGRTGLLVAAFCLFLGPRPVEFPMKLPPDLPFFSPAVLFAFTWAIRPWGCPHGFLVGVRRMYDSSYTASRDRWKDFFAFILSGAGTVFKTAGRRSSESMCDPLILTPTFISCIPSRFRTVFELVSVL